MRWRCITKRWIILTVIIVAIALPTAILAEPPIGKVLEGKYSYVGSRVCVQTPFGAPGEPAPPGFGPNYHLLNYGNVRTGHYKGKLELNRDGTGTLDYILTQIYHQRLLPGQTPLSAWTGSCDVNYYILSDDTIEIQYSNCDGRGAFGVPGDQHESAGLGLKMSLEVSSSRDVLLLADMEPVIETVWSLPPGWDLPFQTERICTRTFTAVRVHQKR